MTAYTKAAQFLWRTYVYCCVLLITCAIIYSVYAFLHLHYRYVQLPNGLQLVATQWFRNAIALKNAKGEIVVQPDVTEIIWNDGYVMGYQYTLEKGTVEFIYKLGNEGPVFSTGESHPLFQEIVMESGLGDVQSKSYESKYQNYLDLLKNKEYRHDWYN